MLLSLQTYATFDAIKLNGLHLLLREFPHVEIVYEWDREAAAKPYLKPHVSEKLRFLEENGVSYAIVKEEWNIREQRLEVTEVLPRTLPLLLGPEGEKLQVRWMMSELVHRLWVAAVCVMCRASCHVMSCQHFLSARVCVCVSACAFVRVCVCTCASVARLSPRCAFVSVYAPGYRLRVCVCAHALARARHSISATPSCSPGARCCRRSTRTKVP